MRRTSWYTTNILSAVSSAAFVGICAMCAGAWLFWSQNLGLRFPFLGILFPLALMIFSYAGIAVARLGNFEVSIGVFALLFLFGLLLSLVVGGILSEIIHCSYDHNGCINL